METRTLAVVMILALSVVGVIGDTLIKRASQQAEPYQSLWFWVGTGLYASGAFGWVFAMRHLSFATIGVIYAMSTVILMALVGITFMQESLRWQQGLAIVFALLAICLVTRVGG